MINRYRFATSGAAMLAAMSLLACDALPVSPRPSLDFTNGPPSPNPVIVRFANATSRVITSDPAQGLIAIHGKVSGLTECTDASTKVPVHIQLVRTPSDVQGLALLLRGTDNDVTIYDHGDISDLTPFDPDKFCPFISETTPVYAGQVQYRLRINGDGNLLFQWQGFVSRTSDGATLHYEEQQYAVPRPGGTVEFIIEEIRLQ